MSCLCRVIKTKRQIPEVNAVKTTLLSLACLLVLSSTTFAQSNVGQVIHVTTASEEGVLVELPGDEAKRVVLKGPDVNLQFESGNALSMKMDRVRYDSETQTVSFSGADVWVEVKDKSGEIVACVSAEKARFSVRREGERPLEGENE